MKKLTLDYSKWRSGKTGKYAVGKGPTLLLNEEGYMCCIGQWCLQAGLTPHDIRDRGTPNTMRDSAKTALSKNEDFGKVSGEFVNFPFTNKAMTINDDSKTTPKEKIKKLKELCNINGITLNVINDSWFKRLFK